MNLDQTSVLLSAVDEPLMLIGLDQRILVANAAAIDVLGDIVGQSAMSVLRQPEAVTCVGDALARRRTARGRLVQTSQAGEVVYRITVKPLSRAAAGIDGAVIHLSDVGHREEAEQMRRDFVANVSHELRSPLTALTGFIETLRTTARDDADAQAKFLTIMAGEAERMDRLIDDLLSLSRVEQEERIRPRSQVNLLSILEACVAALAPAAEARNVSVRIDAGAGPHDIVGDADQLTQVFRNLIENAVKYGPDGGEVQVRVMRQDRAAGRLGPAIRVEVQDQGEGIASEHIPRLTERFYRVDNHRSRAMGGTGLGLAIVKHIVNRHRGRLQIRSSRGEGSVFSVILPLA